MSTKENSNKLDDPASHAKYIDVSTATWEHAERSPNIINFGIGQPHVDLLPRQLFYEAAMAQLNPSNSNSDTRDLLQYASNIGTRGFLKALSEFLTRQYGYDVNIRNLMSTNGNSHGLDFCCSTFGQQDETILVEDPSYWLAHPIFRDHNLNIDFVPQLITGGLDVEGLEVIFL